MTLQAKIGAKMEREFSRLFKIFCTTDLERSTLRASLVNAYLDGQIEGLKTARKILCPKPAFR